MLSMKSIMHKKDGSCYLCMLLNNDYSDKPDLEEHHALFGSRHELAEKFGLKVYLCKKHHTAGGIEAVHFNPLLSSMLKDKAQRRFEEVYPNLDFMKIFGKNYKSEMFEPKEKKECIDGFIRLND